MTNPAHEAAARFLIDARNRGAAGARIPEASRPASVDDALAIQARVAELVGLPIGGYKCSVPNDPRPIWMAPIFAPTISSTSPYPVQGAAAKAKIEPEIAFVLARDLPARATPYREDEVRAAVKEAHLVLEILGSRYAEFGQPSLTPIENLADNVSNQGLFVGPVLKDPWQRKLDAFPITVSTRQGTIDGKHPDGHPLRPLHWLANYLADRGTPLRAGMIVTTGSYCGIVEVPVGEPLTVTYGDLGSLAVTLEKK